MTIFQGDNTAAFGGNFLTINLSYNGEDLPTISRAELKIGCICKSFQNPTFPITINLNEDETAKLQTQNTAYLAVWDAEGRKMTCVGSLTFNTQSRRV
jgi:hypothetical protein